MSTLQYIKHQDIDFKKWDDTILASECPFVFAQSFYLNATCPQWDALIIGDYEAVFPITLKHKMGFTYFPQPPFTSQLGAYGKLNLEREQLFYNYILENFKLIDLELNTSNKLISEFITPKVTYCINYSEGYLLNQNTKRNVAKSEKLGFKVLQVDSNQVLPLSQKHITPFLNKEVGLSLQTISVLDNLIKHSILNNKLICFKVIDELGEIKALAYFVYNNKHAFYLKGNNFDKEESTGSMHLLLKHAIEYFSDKALVFDFGGGSKQGIANFYSGFGAHVVTYGFLRVNKLPKIINILRNNNG